MKSKEKKKHKKHKHKHKHKHKKHKHASSDESESGDEWEETKTSTTRKSPEASTTVVTPQCNDNELIMNTATTSPAAVERKDESNMGDWMGGGSSSLLDVVCSATSGRENKTKQRKDKEKKDEEDKNREIYTKRELNPYFKGGITSSSGGITSSSGGITSSVEKKGSSCSQVKTTTGGVRQSNSTWMQKAYERAKQRAIDENVPFEDIVKKQWGSMEKLNALLKSASYTSSRTTTERGGGSGWRKARPEQDLDKRDNNRGENTESGSSNRGDSKEENDKGNEEEIIQEKVREKSSGCNPNPSLSEKEKNEINAKIVRAEIMGDNDLVEKLKNKLLGKSPTGVSPGVSQGQPRENNLSEKEKNELNAKLLRAELCGNDDEVKRIKRKLNQDIGDDNGDDGGEPVCKGKKVENKKERKEVLLTRSDRHGNLYPVRFNASDSDDDTDTEEDNNKEGHDDEKSSRERKERRNLKLMMEHEQLTSTDDNQAMMNRLAAKHLKQSKARGDDYYTIDDVFVKASTNKESDNTNKQIKERAIAGDRQQRKQLADCRFCLDSSNTPKHLIISTGSTVYLSLPVSVSLTEGHCLIIPITHSPAQTFLDEDVLSEINKFKRTLTNMFNSRDEDVFFFETCKTVKTGKTHCVIECVPVPREVGDMGPIYFKKAISETGSEWSGNKKLVTIKSQQGITRALPKGLPYFAVEFGNDGGFGHVIEEESFPVYFGREIVGGIMDLEPRMWMKPPKESFEQHKRKVFSFQEMWKEFDCTS